MEDDMLKNNMKDDHVANRSLMAQSNPAKTCNGACKPRDTHTNEPNGSFRTELNHKYEPNGSFRLEVIHTNENDGSFKPEHILTDELNGSYELNRSFKPENSHTDELNGSFKPEHSRMDELNGSYINKSFKPENSHTDELNGSFKPEHSRMDELNGSYINKPFKPVNSHTDELNGSFKPEHSRMDELNGSFKPEHSRMDELDGSFKPDNSRTDELNGSFKPELNHTDEPNKSFKPELSHMDEPNGSFRSELNHTNELARSFQTNYSHIEGLNRLLEQQDQQNKRVSVSKQSQTFSETTNMCCSKTPESDDKMENRNIIQGRLGADDLENWPSFLHCVFSHLDGYYARVTSLDYPAWQPDNTHIWQRIHVLPDQPGNVNNLLHMFKELIEEEGVAETGKVLAGFNPNCANAASTLGELYMLTSGIHKNKGWRQSTERVVMDWFLDLFGYDVTGDGLMTSGGSGSSVLAMLAARDALNITGHRIKRCVIYMTTTTHNCLDKALSIVGLSELAVRHVKVDKQRRTDIEDLLKHLAADTQAGLIPVMLVGSAGDVDTGAVDPLEELSNIASNNNMWFHVDAAYGGVFLLCKETRLKMKGISKADSVIYNQHKGLFQPYGCSCVMFKDRKHIEQMQKMTSPETSGTLLEDNPPLRAFYLWFFLSLFGTKRVQEYTEEKLVLTSYLYRELQQFSCLVSPYPPQLTKVVFAVRAPTLEESNRRTEELCKAVNSDYLVFTDTTTIEGRVYFHVCVSSLRAHITQIDMLLERLEKQTGVLYGNVRKQIEGDAHQCARISTLRKIETECNEFESSLFTVDVMRQVYNHGFNLGRHPVSTCDNDPVSLNLPEEGYTIQQLLHHIQCHHYKHLGESEYLRRMSPLETPAVMGHFIIKGTNRFPGMRVSSKAHIELELWIIEWFAAILGLPESATGVLCNDTHSADLLCLLAARCTLLQEAGLYSRAVVYASSSSSLTSLHPVLHVLGLGGCTMLADSNIVSLTQKIQNSAKDKELMPFMVVLTGEEASPGDVSHLVSLCRKLGIWVHLTARQASARVLGDLTHSTLTKQYGLDMADSVSLDLTEVFCQSQSLAVALVREEDKLLATLAGAREATYFRDFQHNLYEPSSMSIELTRPGRQVPLWFTLYSLGGTFLRGRTAQMHASA